MTNMACWVPRTRGLWGHTHLTGLWHWWLNSRSKAGTSTFKQCILYISKWEIRKQHGHAIRKMAGSEDSCGPLEAGRRFAGFISLASWAVAVGTVRCEVLVHGSYSGPIPDSAERRGSSIQIQTSDGFSGPAWLCPWATWHAGIRTPRRRICPNSRFVCGTWLLCRRALSPAPKTNNFLKASKY